MVKTMTRSSSMITFGALPDPKLRRPTIEKAIRLLGWSPRIDLEEGLRRTIQAYREQFHREGDEGVE